MDGADTAFSAQAHFSDNIILLLLLQGNDIKNRDHTVSGPLVSYEEHVFGESETNLVNIPTLTTDYVRML